MLSYDLLSLNAYCQDESDSLCKFEIKSVSIPNVYSVFLFVRVILKDHNVEMNGAHCGPAVHANTEGGIKCTTLQC